MRKFLIAAAVSVSAVAAASPAAAQYYPAPQAPYGNAYGYHNNQQNSVRNFVVRVDQVRYQIDRLDSRDRISEREARGLRAEAFDLRNRVLRSGYNGLNWRERQNLNNRLAQLEQRVRYEANDRDGRRDGWRDGRRDGWMDRDRDGRDDRYEDDRGRYPG